MPAAETEADGGDVVAPATAGGAQEGGPGRDVELDLLGSRERHVVHVREVAVARVDAGRAAEVVDRDRGMPALGEAQRKLLVEGEQPANVG